MPIKKWKKLEHKFMLVNLDKKVKITNLVKAIEEDINRVNPDEDDTETFYWSDFIRSLSGNISPQYLVLKMTNIVNTKFLLQHLKQEKREEVPLKDLAEIFLNAEE
jgi:hypothetical protein